MSGKILERNEKGQITKKELSTEQARNMAHKRHSKKVQKKHNDADMLLAEAGYDDPTEAPKVLQLVAEQIAEGGTRSIQAVVQYRQLTSQQPGTSLRKPKPGENCPLCGKTDVRGITWTPEELDTIRILLQELRTKGSSTAKHVDLKRGRRVE